MEMHGLTKTGEYKTWTRMKTRCYNVNCHNYKHYGGRGIKICDRWRNSFKNFIEDIGTKPHKKYTIERIDNDGDYAPGNCKWATQQEQQLNRRGHQESSSKYKGVSKRGDRWEAKIKHKGKQYFLGYFELEITAAQAYNFKAYELHGSDCKYFNEIPVNTLLTIKEKNEQ